jgi:hypothetical protein
VNRVSASHVATDRGIAIRELRTAQPASRYSSLVMLRVFGGDGQPRVVAGTLGADRTARLTQWQNFEIEARLGGSTLVVASADRPGVIGHIGSALGAAQINVGRVQLGTTGSGGALSIWNLDSEPPKSFLDELKSSANVTSAALFRV